MAEVIRMPRMSDTMEEGNIIEWLKKVGDSVEPGDVLAEVETDKATMELESFYEGVLLHIGVKQGPVPVNGVLAVIGEEGEDYKAALAAEESASVSNGQAGSSETNEPAAQQETHAAKAEVKATPAISANAGDGEGDRIKASPLARKMAEDKGIDLKMVSGSGDQGRIVKKDIESASSQTSGGSAASYVSSASGMTESYRDEPLSQMRKTIARRLGESKFQAPHFYLTIDIDMSAAMAARKQINEFAPVKISYNDFVVKACALALREHKAVNSSWLGDRIRYNDHINIGVAVAVEDGLLVPVVRFADRKGLAEINQEVKTLAGKAKNKKLGLDEMQGNTFTISNLGMFGIEEFTAIINPPDACIMAVGGIREIPVVRNGEIVIGHKMKVTLSCDHRVVDGATGAQFLNTVKAILESPMSLAV